MESGDTIALRSKSDVLKNLLTKHWTYKKTNEEVIENNKLDLKKYTKTPTTFFVVLETNL
jgi:hypothetical protein